MRIELIANPEQEGILYEEKLEALREGYRIGAAIPPIVAVQTSVDTAMIIEGHHRAIVAKEFGIEPAVIIISAARLRRYNAEGMSYDDIEYDVQYRAHKAQALKAQRKGGKLAE